MTNLFGSGRYLPAVLLLFLCSTLGCFLDRYRLTADSHVLMSGHEDLTCVGAANRVRPTEDDLRW